MGKIIYRTGDMFSQMTSGLFLAHACNCQGSWNSGVAVAFKQHCPDAHKKYQQLCYNAHDKVSMRGKNALLYDESSQCFVGCLFTSVNYGKLVDPPSTIVQATESSFEQLLQQIEKKIVSLNLSSVELRLPMINSLRFNVDWSLSEKIIEEALERHSKLISSYVYRF